jgi:glycosyltransferase involved in cell wall biosynthesis
MKIAILGSRGIPARYGGFETFAEQLSTRLASEGIDVTVFCPSASRRPDETYLRVKLRYIESPRAGSFTEILWDAKCFWTARRGFDVVYMLGVGASFAAWLPRLFGSSVWINSDGLEWKRSKWSLPQRIYLVVAETLSVCFASTIIADSVAIERYLRARYSQRKRISTIAYGAQIPAATPDKSLIDAWDLRPDEYYIVICRLEPENHVLEILDGFERSKSNLCLVIVGNIENPNRYVESLLAYQSSKVRFIGTVYDQRRLAALRFYARGYLHGHSVGGTNPSLLEAMACSNLVIAHDNEFNREVLEDSGLYFTGRDQVAEIINATDSGQVDVASHRQQAAGIVSRRYLWNHVADAYLKLLEREYEDRSIA